MGMKKMELGFSRVDLRRVLRDWWIRKGRGKVVMGVLILLGGFVCVCIARLGGVWGTYPLVREILFWGFFFVLLGGTMVEACCVLSTSGS